MMTRHPYTLRRNVFDETIEIWRPDMTDEVKMATIPNCDMCGEPARYDGKTTHGPWAYMCERHWASDGNGKLGTGRGQRLVKGS